MVGAINMSIKNIKPSVYYLVVVPIISVMATIIWNILKHIDYDPSFTFVSIVPYIFIIISFSIKGLRDNIWDNFEYSVVFMIIGTCIISIIGNAYIGMLGAYGETQRDFTLIVSYAVGNAFSINKSGLQPAYEMILSDTLQQILTYILGAILVGKWSGHFQAKLSK